ncbi:MAG: hypothetical protein ACRDP3_13040 [Streptomyces sp.]|uniref:hypothetical protein n=1 Tax=Streptomyces sp. TaxID=1931 RepID=UPI003D6C27B0
MSDAADGLPAWVTWQRRPFPDANLLLLHGRQPALVGAVVQRDGRLHAAAEHTPVAAETLQVPYPRAWPAATTRRR